MNFLTFITLFVGFMSCHGQNVTKSKTLKLGVVLDPSFLQSNLQTAKLAIEKVSTSNNETNIQVEYFEDKVIVIPDGNDQVAKTFL